MNYEKIHGFCEVSLGQARMYEWGKGNTSVPGLETHLSTKDRAEAAKVQRLPDISGDIEPRYSKEESIEVTYLSSLMGFEIIDPGDYPKISQI